MPDRRSPGLEPDDALPTTGYDARDNANRVEPDPAADAFWITKLGDGSGAHFTDRLLLDGRLDGRLDGFYHDDFQPGFVPRSATHLPPEEALEIFESLEAQPAPKSHEQSKGFQLHRSAR